MSYNDTPDKCAHCFERMDVEASTTVTHDDGEKTHGECAQEYRDDECTECFHPKRHHGEYGCEVERDHWVTGHDGTEGLVAQPCGCPTFVRFTQADKLELSAVEAAYDAWRNR